MNMTAAPPRPEAGTPADVIPVARLIADAARATPLGWLIAGSLDRDPSGVLGTWAEHATRRALGAEGGAVDVLRGPDGTVAAAAVWLPDRPPRLDMYRLVDAVGLPAAARITMVETLLDVAARGHRQYRRLVGLAVPDDNARGCLLRHRHRLLDAADVTAVAFTTERDIDSYGVLGYWPGGNVPLPGGSRLTHLYRPPAPWPSGGL